MTLPPSLSIRAKQKIDTRLRLYLYITFWHAFTNEIGIIYFPGFEIQIKMSEKKNETGTEADDKFISTKLSL